MSIPEAFYRETIDLNRYSNSVAGKYAKAYNDIIARAAERLVNIDFRQQGTTNAVAPETRKRLRAIIKQSKDSLNRWSGESAKAFKKELQDLAVLQTEFIKNELKKVVASGDVPINNVAVSTGFGDAVVSTDPTRLNLFGRPEEEFKDSKAGSFELTKRRGELITLPNGETAEKAFRGIAAKSSERLGGAIRQGVLSGETNVQIARRLMGRLNFNEYTKKGTRAFALAGNQPLKLANHQIKTIVRTSVNQVSNAANQSVYAANRDVAPKYEYVATLDSRTSSVCQRLDGQIFGYDQGPTPPQHFNCRSTTVPVIDYEGLKKRYPKLEAPSETTKKGKSLNLITRPSETGRVPQKVSYGDWLYEQRARGAKNQLLKYEPGPLQIKTLGFEKAKYFNRLAARSNGTDALRKIIRSDGTEITLEGLKKKYGKPIDIKATKKAIPKIKTKETPKAKPKAKIPDTPKPVINKYIKKFEKQSDNLFEEDFAFNKATLDVKKFEAAGKIRNSKSVNVVTKAKTQLKEAEEGLKYLEKRHLEIKEQWRRENLPLLPKTQPLKKLNKKEMSSSLSKYEKDLALKEKALNPKDPLYEDKLDTIRGQQFNIEQMRKRLKANLPVNDFDHTTPMGYIYDRQGFNSKPKRVKTFNELQTSKDILKAADGENLILYRGVKEKEFALQFKGIGKDGAQHFPGNGIYGNGTYAASRNYDATGKEVLRQSQRARTTAEVYATNYTGAFQEVSEDLSILQKKERVTAFGFKKDAKVVRWQKGADAMEGTDEKWLAWQEMINEQAEKATGLTFDSTGEAASALGIDAYQVPNAGGVKGLKEDYWVILNRGALIVADEAGY